MKKSILLASAILVGATAQVAHAGHKASITFYAGGSDTGAAAVFAGSSSGDSRLWFTANGSQAASWQSDDNS